ncbi:MAG: YggS family pyridoxal phosphate-dependent enzyme [Alphaproteobacteria bacterium]
MAETPAQPVSASRLPENLARVRAEIAEAARAGGRDPSAVTLIAVSKGHDAVAAATALAAGQRVFGENRVQEAQAKWPSLRETHADIELHLIGPLQTNKARDAVALFDVIQTLDRARLADALAAEMAKQGKRPRLFVQVNTGEEVQKAGVLPAEAAAFARWCRDDKGLPVVGLMCIPPIGEEPALHFALLRELAMDANLAQLSMGMSADFAIAARLGATHVRVGTAIFGERAYPAREQS